MVASVFVKRVIYPKSGLKADKTTDHQISSHALFECETLSKNVFLVRTSAAVNEIPELIG